MPSRYRYTTGIHVVEHVPKRRMHPFVRVHKIHAKDSIFKFVCCPKSGHKVVVELVKLLSAFWRWLEAQQHSESDVGEHVVDAKGVQHGSSVIVL